MVLLGYSLAIMMGLTLGLIGAGGSILTVPILVYLLGVKPVLATGYSLLVVGSTALFGTYRYWRNGNVYLKIAVTFAIPAMIAVWLTRKFFVPALPPMLIGIPKDSFIMLLFAVLMVAASIFMLRPVKESSSPSHQSHDNPLYFVKLILGSLCVGWLTAMVGAGGGFLIIPSLIALFNLSMKEAIGTSLAVITMNSFIGFNGDLSSGIVLNWALLISFIALTLLGMGLGTKFAHRIDGKKLKQGFGILALIVAIMVFTHEFLLIFRGV